LILRTEKQNVFPKIECKSTKKQRQKSNNQRLFMHMVDYTIKIKFKYLSYFILINYRK